MEKQERRAPGIHRVPVERLVEICGRDERVPAFEAESIELSGRGMHVRTPYLPELAAPLVCRIEDRGREIVVEGVVAWRKETELGGEFGIKFTALDSGSVETLKALCGLGGAPAPPTQAPAKEIRDPALQPPRGAPVKLHIEGLGAPMRARVRRGGTSRLHVGSNLEFLKVGRNLEIEDVEQQQRAGARIDAVSVAIDPQTQVPELVVTLRYEGATDVTPEPTVVDEEQAASASEVGPVKASALHSAPVDSLDEEGEEELFEEDNPFDSGLSTLASKAATAAQSTGGALMKIGAGTFKTMGRLFASATDKVAESRARRPRQQKPRIMAPFRGHAPAGQRLRPQSGARKVADPEVSVGRKKAIAISAVALSGLLAASAYVFGNHRAASTEGQTPVHPTTPSEPAAPPAAKMAPVAPPAKAKKTNQRGIVADVPLFGPTPMATLEPAPLEPPPDDIEQQAPAVDVPDESFDEQEAAGSTNPKASKPWGQGRLHLPFVHRLRLDAPGAVFEGRKLSTGFTVFVPKRKLLDSGSVIAKRDDRIIGVRTANEPDGARITFQFRGEIPPYKVRLRGDHIEFFVSDGDAR